jgi:hypothetical protein
MNKFIFQAHLVKLAALQVLYDLAINSARIAT